MAVNSTSAPELTAEQVQRILTQPLEQTSTFLNTSVRIYDTASPIRLPSLGKLVTDGTTTPDEPDWVAESELISTKSVDFGEVELMPSTMSSIKVISRYSNELARQSVVALDAAIQQRLVRDVANKLDRQLWSYTGDGVTQPKGLLAYSGVQTLDKAESALTIDDLIDAWGMCLSAHVDMSGLRWVMRPEQLVKMYKIKELSNSQRPVLQPDLTNSVGYTLLGAPVTVTTFLPTGPDSTDVDTVANEQNVILADFSQIAVARDVAPSVTILRERYADYDEQALRVVTRYDAAPLNPQAIVKITNISAS